jgi:DNA sulfur modification protein DndD
MLVFDRLTVQDFGPYRGRQELPFSREAGVYIIYAPNGRGKTTLHNAFRYALYGQIFGRRRAEQARELVNSEARKHAGFGSFETVLDFRHEGTPYRLTRRYDESQTPLESTFLERQGVPLSQDDTEKTLQVIAPLSVSQFFLFDGELLRQYEKLLDEDSDEGAALEENIERVLGIPIVGNARADVLEIQRAAEKQLTEQYAAHDETRRLGLSLQEARDVRARMIEGRDQINERIETAKERVAELERALRQEKKAERLLGSLDSLRGQLAEMEQRERDATESLSELSGELWKAVLRDSAEKRLDEVEEQAASAELELRDATAAIRDLEHLQGSDDCPVCRQEVPNDLRGQLIHALEPMATAGHKNSIEDRLERLRGVRRTLQALSRQDGRLIAERDRNLRQVRLDLKGVRDEIDSTEQQLAEIGSEDKLRTDSAERAERQAQILRDKERLETAEARITEQDQVIEDLKRRLRKEHIRPDDTLETKDQLTRQLAELLADSIDAYRTKLRRTVEDHASEVFGRIASEPDYVGLRITDSYGLEIIDSDGEVVKRRSAGYEHLVALSLIAALQDSAAIRGPVVMDYPFGRLDKENTSRVVAALPRMARQVVLLAFDGEFDRTAALKALGTDLVAEFELERVTSKHTRIAPRRSL